MSNNSRAWAAALEDAAPVADIDINITGDEGIDLDEDGAPLEAVDAEGEPTYDAVETEMTEDEAEVAEAEDVVEQLEETAVQLESAAVAIENRIKHHGGMTSGELEFLMIGLNGRVKNANRLFPSNESFSYSRLSASNEAMDSIKNGLQYIWETLKNAINAVFNKLRQWFDTTLRGATKLLKRANGIWNTQRSLDNSSPQNDKVSINFVDSFVGRGGKIVDTGAAALTQIKSLHSAAESILQKGNAGAWVTYIENSAKALDALVKGDKGNTFDAAAAITTLTNVNGWETGGFNFNGTSDNTRFAGYNTATTDELPGRKKVYFFKGPSAGKPTTDEAYASAMKHRGFRLDDMGGTAPKKEGKMEFTTMSSSEIGNVAGEVAKIADLIIGYKSSWERRDQSVRNTQKEIDRTVLQVDKRGGDHSGNAARQKVLGTMLRGLAAEIRNAPSADAKFISYTLKTSNDYLLYCTRSLAQYKKIEKKKK